MDGTLVDSTAGLTGAWEVFKQKYPNIDIDHILSCKISFYLALLSHSL